MSKRKRKPDHHATLYAVGTRAHPFLVYTISGGGPRGARVKYLMNHCGRTWKDLQRSVGAKVVKVRVSLAWMSDAERREISNALRTEVLA